MAADVRGRGARELNEAQTIFALSSGAVPAAIAVMRVSGPAAGEILGELVGDLPLPRRATLRSLRDHGGALLDRCLVLWLPGPATATGEDLAELHLHGSRATVAAVAAALQRCGARPAQGGEFTRRALEHGRLDLTQAEGLADLLAAETEEERRLALATSEGQLSRALHGWYDRLAAIRADLEARIDHADEDDVASGSATFVGALRELLEDVREVLARPTVERLRQGLTIVLAGPPNAGKSSLFNALVERDAAIVTPIAGTTRDVIEASVVRGGRAYRLLDTAGLTETHDPVEQIGVDRAEKARAVADLTLWLDDAPPPPGERIWVNARCDLPGRAERTGTDVSVSVRSPDTVESLWTMIERCLEDSHARDATFLLGQRQHMIIQVVAQELAGAAREEDELIVAERLRRASRLLDDVLGRDAPEAMLDALFARFCIGK